MKHQQPNPPLGHYPHVRMRRNRRTDWCRRMVAETQLSVNDLIWPVFVQEGSNLETPIKSMPGVARYSIDRLSEKAAEAADLGIPAIALFPVIDQTLKNNTASEASNPDNLICRAIHALKKAVPDIGVICDVALDPYTTHGHDGLLHNNSIDNDSTIEVLCAQALVQAQAGCDIIAPSDMMDGRIGAIRAALDNANYHDTSILAYAAKYASSFYGPFRDAVGSAQALGSADKRTYQMNPANSDEAMREIALDINEGADMVMIKPGLPYLDIIHRARQRFDVPIFAYHVSGEYSMLHAAAKQGWLDANTTLHESILSLKRAGASAILTYGALSMAQQLK